MTETEALEKSITLWTALIDELSKMSQLELRELSEYALNDLKHNLDPDSADCTWNCYLCEFFTAPDESEFIVDCDSCCISYDCGQCNQDNDNEFERLTSEGMPRITKLRAANRILRSMKARLLKLQTQETPNDQG
jgi:hypothetical protein